MTRLASRIGLAAAALLYVVVCAASFFPDRYWAFETLSNIRVQLAMLGACGTLVLLIMRLRIAGFFVASLAIAQAVSAINVADRVATVATTPANLRVMTINIGFDNHRDDARLVAMIKHVHPDVLVLVQDVPERRRAIAESVGLFPYHAEAGIDLRAVSIDSRFPILHPQMESRSYVAHILTCEIEVPVDGTTRKIFFVATHPTVPLSPGFASERKTALAYLAKRAAEQRAPVVIAGDFNTTPHSLYFTRLLYDGRLADTARGRFPAPTWLSAIPGFGLRIDHVLVSPEIAVGRHETGDPFGSDHRAVIVDLVIPPAS